MKNLSIVLSLAALLSVAVLASSSAAEDATAAPAVLADGVGAKSRRADHTHQVRYIEIFLAFRDPNTGKLVAACYNSMFSSRGIPESKDTCPQKMVEGLDFPKMSKELGLLGASLNGPKILQPDWVELQGGKERDFNGIMAPWVAQLNMGDNSKGVTESAPYKPMTIERNSGLGWNKGTVALLLDDAEGNTWIMKGFQVGLKPTYTFEEFVALGQARFQKLPAGWKFRVKTLDADLIERPEGGVAAIMPDEFFNIYDKTGPGMTNYKP